MNNIKFHNVTLLIFILPLAVLFSGFDGSANTDPAEGNVIQFPEMIKTIVWSPDGKRLAASNGNDSRVYGADPASGQIVWRVDKKGPRPRGALTFSRDGDALITSSTISSATENPNSMLTVLSPKDGSILRQISEVVPKVSDEARARALALSANKDVAAVILNTNPSIIAFYDTKSWTKLSGLLTAGDAFFVGMDDDRHEIAVGLQKGLIEVFDASSMEKVRELRVLNSTLSGMAIAGSRVYVAGSGVTTANYARNGSGETTVDVLTDDPSRLVSAWDLATGQKILSYEGPGVGVIGLAVSPNGKYVAATEGCGPGKGSSLTIWDADTGKIAAQIDYPRGLAHGVAFDSDGREIAVAVEGTVHVIRAPD